MLKRFYISGALLLFGITGCTGGNPVSHQTGRISFKKAVEQTKSLPPSAPGNAEVSPHDEAPILRNEAGIPIRKDRESQQSLIYFSGFNEE